MNYQSTSEVCFNKIRQSKANLIYLLGESDSGKTTLIKDIANELISAGEKVAIIDADIGQSSRLPLTVSLSYAYKSFSDFSELMLVEEGFVPSYNLMSQLERYVRLISRYTEQAREKANYSFIDPTGFVKGRAGIILKRKEMESIAPNLVIALQRGNELEPILERLTECKVLKFPTPREAKRRSAKLRKKMREERFRLYFKNSTIQHIDCAPPPSWEYRIVGLYDHEKFLGLGVAKNKEATKLGVITPVWAKATGIEFGYIKLDPERGEAYISR